MIVKAADVLGQADLFNYLINCNDKVIFQDCMEYGYERCPERCQMESEFQGSWLFSLSS